MQIKVLAPAKINLSLDIVNKRADGYHDVAMVMQTVSLYDEITLSDEVSSDSQDITITCDLDGVPLDSSNIVHKAATAFFKYCDIKDAKISIDIKKNIPTQAGLAGGSTDGAAVILALNKMFSTHLSDKEMCEISAKIGADVPFCLLGGTQLATDTGTTLYKLPNLTKCYIVICKPDISVSTAQAYAKCDSRPYKTFKVTDEIVSMIYKRNIRNVANSLYNEFEAVLELPEIVEIKRMMLKNKALGACMSGSGSAVFGIFLDEKKARKCIDAMSSSYDKLYLCEPVSHGCKIE